jgi:hypothetical protein
MPNSSRLTHLAFICIEKFLAVIDWYYKDPQKGGEALFKKYDIKR